MIASLLPSLVFLLVFVLAIASAWKIYSKAGQPGWASLIPLYNFVVYLRIVKRPLWWILLLFIPLVNIVIAIVITSDLSKRFGKGIGFTLGLIFLSPIFYPILGFGDAQYQG